MGDRTRIDWLQIAYRYSIRRIPAELHNFPRRVDKAG